MRRRYYQPSGADAFSMSRPADRDDRRPKRVHRHDALQLGPGAVVLGIESSCDETGAGLVGITDDAPLDCSATHWRPVADQHARFGGVVPEIASRAHLEAMTPTVRSGLRRRVCVGGGRCHRGHQRSRVWPARCWSAWPPRRRTPRPGTCRCSGSTTWPATSPPTPWSTGCCPARPGAAGLRRPHPAAADREPGRGHLRDRHHRR